MQRTHRLFKSFLTGCLLAAVFFFVGFQGRDVLQGGVQERLHGTLRRSLPVKTFNKHLRVLSSAKKTREGLVISGRPVRQYPGTQTPLDPLLPKPEDKVNETILAHVEAVIDPNRTTFQMLECPTLQRDRYDHLRSNESSNDGKLPKYFFALDLHQSAKVLPRLMGSIVETVRFLGPQDCAVSVVEGRSQDETLKVLIALREALDSLGIRYFLNSSTIDPKRHQNEKGRERIQALAELRNIALQPLVDMAANVTTSGDTISTMPTVIFLNDVAICPEDILELVHQREHQSADMVCAMDWNVSPNEPDATFYDVWISRAINGDSFFEIPASGSWDLSRDLFWNEPATKQAFSNHRPFQVFSCWNGATAFTAKPLLDSQPAAEGESDSNTTGLRFRGPRENECPQGEPTLFCADMWSRGYSRIAVVPTVNVAYSDEQATMVKNLRGYVSEITSLPPSLIEQLHLTAGNATLERELLQRFAEEEERVRSEAGDDAVKAILEADDLIGWIEDPPEMVKCMSSWAHQTWEPWDPRLAAALDQGEEGEEAILKWFAEHDRGISWEELVPPESDESGSASDDASSSEKESAPSEEFSPSVEPAPPSEEQPAPAAEEGDSPAPDENSSPDSDENSTPSTEENPPPSTEEDTPSTPEENSAPPSEDSSPPPSEEDSPPESSEDQQADS